MAERREARGGTLIAGGGFAGSYVARLLGKRGATIVSPDNFMLFTPLLPEAASGPLLTRKLRVVADWTTALFFRRDIAELSIRGHPRRLE